MRIEIGTEGELLKCSETIKTNVPALGAGWKDVTNIFPFVSGYDHLTGTKPCMNCSRA